MSKRKQTEDDFVFRYMAALQANQDREFAEILRQSREVVVEDCKEANELIAKIKSNLKRLGK